MMEALRVSTVQRLNVLRQVARRRHTNVRAPEASGYSLRKLPDTLAVNVQRSLQSVHILLEFQAFRRKPNRRII